MKSCFLAAILLCVAMGSTFGDSIVLFNELTAVSAGSDSITQFGPLAESFSTGVSAVSLTDIMVKLDVAQNNAVNAAIRRHTAGTSVVVRPEASSAPGVTVALYSDAGLQLGTLISTLGTVPDSSLPAVGMYKNFDFPVNPPIALTAKTRYWVVFSSTNSVAGLAWTTDTNGGGRTSTTSTVEGFIPTAPPTTGRIR